MRGLVEREFVFRASTVIRSWLRNSLPEVLSRFENQEAEVYMQLSAQIIARQLRMRPDEDDIQWVERVRFWVVENDPAGEATKPPGFGAAWPAYRMHAPAGCKSAIALFAVMTPVQESWTLSHKKPPMNYAMENISVDCGKPLSSFVSSVFDSKYPEVTCIISDASSPVTANMVSKAICAFSKLSDTLTSRSLGPLIHRGTG